MDANSYCHCCFGVRERINWDVKQWRSCHNKNHLQPQSPLHSASVLRPITLQPWYQTPNLDSSHPLYMTGFPASESNVLFLGSIILWKKKKNKRPVCSILFTVKCDDFSYFFSNQSAVFSNMLHDSAATEQTHERFKVLISFLLRLFMNFICR